MHSGGCNATRLRIPIITAAIVQQSPRQISICLARGNALRDSDAPSRPRTDVSVSCASRWTRIARASEERSRMDELADRREGRVNVHFRRDFSVPRSGGFLNRVISRPVSGLIVRLAVISDRLPVLPRVCADARGICIALRSNSRPRQTKRHNSPACGKFHLNPNPQHRSFGNRAFLTRRLTSSPRRAVSLAANEILRARALCAAGSSINEFRFCRHNSKAHATPRSRRSTFVAFGSGMHRGIVRA